jgi:hypothetical protein
MEDDNESFGQAAEHRMAIRLFDAAFGASKRLPYADQQALLKEIAKRILREIPNASPEEQKAVRIVGIEIGQTPQ